MSLSDDAFLLQFEQKSLPPEAFGHRGHLRLAWVYLNRFGLHRAIEKSATGIAAYAAHQGAKDKFHHTLTEAIVRILFSRMKPSDVDQEFERFLGENPDLVDNMKHLVSLHYSEDLLSSDFAKQHYVPPDLLYFPRDAASPESS